MRSTLKNVSTVNNDQNIIRVWPKMYEGISHQNNAKLTNCNDAFDYFIEIKNTEEASDEPNIPFDHMYALNTKNTSASSNSKKNCQSSESEVKFLKDWLNLQLNIIQQQKEELLEKEKTILILQKENEMLKERINCLEKGTTSKIKKQIKNLHIKQEEIQLEANISEDMTQDLDYKVEDKKTVKLHKTNCDNGNNRTLEIGNVQGSHKSDIESHNKCKSVAKSIPVKDDAISNSSSVRHKTTKTKVKSETVSNLFLVKDKNISNSYKVKNETISSKSLKECDSNRKSKNYYDEFSVQSEITTNKIAKYNFTVEHCANFDPMKNLRMSIRRKRVFSNSSSFSNNESIISEEKKPHRTLKKKRKCFTKETQIISTSQPYLTQAGEVDIGLPIIEDVPVPTEPEINLEVPRWRIKHYTTSYTMEGTENLDDEIYNKRHSRLEINERRRKRWDFQRIREQRVVEKLKQRQERIGSGSRGTGSAEPVTSFYPKIEDIKYIEVVDELPVCAFGHPIPKINPSEFTLPWLENPSILEKKVNTKRSKGRRKGSKR